MTVLGRGFSSNLFSDLAVTAEVDVPLGPRTWYGIGGRADLLVTPETVAALETLVHRCHRSNVPLRILGSGANLLVLDEGVGGIVVHLGATAFREITFNPTGREHLVRAMAGADLAKTLMETIRHGLGGLDPLAGIPASIGGAVRMNAGGAFGAIGSAIDRVVCITRQGERVTYPADELRFDYRTSNIPDPIIVAAIFALEPGDPIKLRDRVKEIFEYKKSSQPLAESSAGCVFRNPWDPVREERVSAGRLIDESGLKGHAVGGASVSRQHANFIVVEPKTATHDLLTLMQEIRRRVFDSAGILLEDEIVTWSRESDHSGEDVSERRPGQAQGSNPSSNPGSNPDSGLHPAPGSNPESTP